VTVLYAVCQYEGKVQELKERIEKTRKHILQKHKRKDTLHSKSVHILADICDREEQINKFKYSCSVGGCVFMDRFVQAGY